jgi:dolichol-phosphate mannosyltransferase
VELVTKLSVVMPVFNEGDVIEQLVLDVEREIVAHFPGAEAIVVDDRSTDATPGILERLARERPWLHVEHADANAGHGPSIVRGLALARGEWIFQLDSDGQVVVAEFAKLWACRLDADLVLGVRVRRRDPAHRLLLSKVVAAVVSALARRRLRDPNVPFRLVRRDVWEDLRPLVGLAPLAPSILLAVGAAARGRRIAEVPITHLPRARGTSSLRSARLVAFSLRGLWQLLVFRARLARSS